MTVLVTGGAGYFGEVLSQALLAKGIKLRVFDLNAPGFAHQNLEFAQGDIRDSAAVAAACRDIEVIYHNVAQVPLAKNKHLFWSVNSDGTRILLEQARKSGVRKLVYTSSSAVFGAPARNPVTEDTPPMPAEDYGRAKLAGEELCRTSAEAGLDVTIIRPRTILGHGRLGVAQILFEWIRQGHDVPVFDAGKNIYQFVHADDLASACIAAADRKGFAVYNIGARKFATMAETLAAVIRHAGSGSRLRSVPIGPAQFMMKVMEKIGASPLGPYHALMYGRSLYFDVAKAERELGWAPRYGNQEMICESYDWYVRNREKLVKSSQGRSRHQSPLRQGVLACAPLALKFFPEVEM